VTTSTDGYIALWSVPPQTALYDEKLSKSREDFNWRYRHRVHQSSIKCLSHMLLAPALCLLFTGGDDNAIGVTILRIGDGDQDFTTTHQSTGTILIPRAHAAAVTACKLVNLTPTDGSEFLVRAVTTSNDQQVAVWDIGIDGTKNGVEGVNVMRIDKVPTAVADASALVLIDNDDTEGQEKEISVVVCGVGMESWRMKIQ
jgi:WD repeat-containing protein 6